MENNEITEEQAESIFPPDILRAWLNNTSASCFYDRLKWKVMGQDEELKKARKNNLLCGYDDPSDYSVLC